MENLALARLKQAANKNKTNADNNGVHSSNLVSLTGSPGVKDRKVSGGGARSDMDVSDDDHSDIRDSFLEDGYPPPVRDKWDDRGVHPPWDNGPPPPPPQAPVPHQDRFSAPPPMFPGAMSQHRPGFNGNHGANDSPSPAFHNTARPPPPFLPSSETSDHPGSGPAPGFDSHSQVQANLQMLASPSEAGRGRGNFRPSRGFGHRGGGDSGASPRFPGAPNSRFQGPPPSRGGGGGFQGDRFGDSDGQDSDGRGGGRGGARGAFRGGSHKDFDAGSRGRGGPRGGWNGSRRPWGNMRGRGGGGRGGGGNW